MKVLVFILLVALVGCSRSDTASPALQMSRQIQQWIPKGTPVAAVRELMEQHQFVCTVDSYASREAMPPGSDRLWWNIGSFISRDGRTLPVTNVTILACKRADTHIEYQATFTAVDGEFDGRYAVSASGVR